MVDGSKIARGRKKRTNIRKQVVRKPAIVAQTILRRSLFTGGSGVLSTRAGFPFGAAATEAGAGLPTGAALGGTAADAVLSGIAISPDWLSTICNSSVDWNH